MIPLQFSLFWAGEKLSYLRYLTFKSLRHFHPNSDITLYISHEFNKKANKWGGECQDFERKNEIEDYLEKLKDIDVKTVDIKYVGSPEYCPILQADLFRWVWMKENGGIYLDTDQIILNSFESLPLDKEFIYCRYMEAQCGDYLPVGVLGLEKNSIIADVAIKCAVKIYSAYNYNSSGPFMMREVVKHIDLSRSFNAPYYYFYPVNSSKDVDKIYNGSVKIDDRALALHWFGGHTLSQKFNEQYTEDSIKTSKDLISKILLEKGICK